MFEMALHDLLAEAAEGLLDAGDLDEDVGAVAIFFDHFVQAADLALDPFEPLEVFSLVIVWWTGDGGYWPGR